VLVINRVELLSIVDSNELFFGGNWEVSGGMGYFSEVTESFGSDRESWVDVRKHINLFILSRLH
jgi:hypothetical protein